MKYLPLFILIGIFLISNLPNSYSQPFQNTSLPIENKIIDMLEKEIRLGEKVSENEAMLQQTSTDLHTFETDTQNQINNIEKNSRNEFIATTVVSVISIMISGYIGWHIHKRQFNSDLSKKHFEDIKEQIIQPFKNTFLIQINNFNELGKRIQDYAENDIVSTRSFDLWGLSHHKDHPEYTGQMDVQLFIDLLHNHYPELRRHLEKIFQVSTNYNNLRDEMLQLGQLVIKPIIEDKYMIVDSEPVSLIPEGTWHGSINISSFADILVTNIISNFPSEQLKTVRHRDNTMIALADSDNKQSRIIFQIKPDSNDEIIVQECIKKFYSSNEIKMKAIEAGRSFSNFKNAVDTLGLDLDRISNKVILNTRRRFFITTCTYVQEKLR